MPEPEDYRIYKGKILHLDWPRVGAAFQDLIKSQTSKHLLQAYKEYTKRISASRFITTLLSFINRQKIPKEYNDVEYETKINIIASQRGVKESGDYLRKILDCIPENPKFLPNNSLEDRLSENYYFSDRSENTLVVMRGLKSIINLKYKNDSFQKILLGINNEEYVIKRQEKIERKCSTDKALKEIQRAILSGALYSGRIMRHRTRTDFLSVNTARTYTVVFDICEVSPEQNDSFKIMQLETEYTGYIPNLTKTFVYESERQIVTELLELTDLLNQAISKIKEQKKITILDSNYTKETKFNFLKSNGQKIK